MDKEKSKMFDAKLIPVVGDEVQVKLPGGDFKAVLELLGGAELFQTVRIRGGMMLVDDNGLRKGLAENPRASRLYGNRHIVGPALLFTEAEWLAYDASYE